MADVLKNPFAWIGAVGTLISIWSFFRNRKRLCARGRFLEAAFPPHMKQAVESFSQGMFELATDISVKLQPIKSNIKKLRDKIPSNLFLTSYYWTFDIQNKGNVEVTDLQLRLPFGGFYTTTQPGEEGVSEFDRKITVGALRPSESVLVSVWTYQSLAEKEREQISLTHTAGRVPIEFPQEFYGLSAGFTKWLEGDGGGLLKFLSGAILFFVVLHWFDAQKVPNGATTNPTSQPTSR